MRVLEGRSCRQISENVWQIKKLTQKQKAIILKLQKKTAFSRCFLFSAYVVIEQATKSSTKIVT
jgi:hypothetical protein